MNVVILTPDGVGSTLLQRVLTVQMILSDFDKPVINLHELTNGIYSCYSTELESMVLRKNFSLGYNQSLPNIVELLMNHDHYKTSRLAMYHIQRRNDSFEDQKYFYDYLNENFFIISARRNNLFEYGLSWCLRDIHKKLNVYSSEEKIFSFLNYYTDPVNIDTEQLLKHLEEYKTYFKWSNQNFDIGSNFYYEKHVPDLENYILNLPVFSGKSKTNWKDAFQISFENFNKCHKSFSDIGALALQSTPETKKLTFENKPQTIKQIESNIVSHLPVSTQNFVSEHEHNYRKTKKTIEHLVNLGLMVGNLPIKKQTFAEKKFIIKNFYECLLVFNDWISKNSEFGQPINNDLIQLQVDKDTAIWSTEEQQVH